jgi:hypothetical protein
MRIAVSGCLLIGGLLGGCGGVDDTSQPPAEQPREPYEELFTAADTSRAFATAEAVGVVTVQGGAIVEGPLTAVGNFRGTVDDAPPGSLTIREVDGGTQFLISVTRYQPNTELQATVVRAPCDEPGQVVHVLEPVIQIPTEGIANVEATAPVQMRTLFDGMHSIRLVHPEDARAGIQEVAMVRGCAAIAEHGGPR